ncbi:DNA primase, partial [Salmonella enterica]|nr:DNA primase [Salmonella enterica]
MKAPNLKYLPKDKATEAIIFAGDEAKTLATYWNDSAGKAIALDNTPPVYLTPYHLGRINDCQIVDNGRVRARIYRAGKIDEILISAIVEKLAVADVKDIRIFKSITDNAPECLNKEATDRIRKKAKNGESVFNDEVFSPLLKKQMVRSELEPYVQSRNDGVFYIEPKQNKGSVDIINNETLLCSPVNIIGSGWDESEDRYLVLRMKQPGKNK